MCVCVCVRGHLQHESLARSPPTHGGVAVVVIVKQRRPTMMNVWRGSLLYADAAARASAASPRRPETTGDI